MRWLRTPLARFLIYLAVALVVAAAVADLFGVKLSTSYSASVPSSQVGAVAVVVMPTSVNGLVTINASGAEEVIYMNMGVNPIGLLPQVKGLGLKIVSEQVDEDLRAGVIIDIAGLQGNPIFVEQAFQGVIKYAPQTRSGNYTITDAVSPDSYLVAVVVPASNSSYVNVAMHFRVEGYGRLTNAGIASTSVILAAVAVAYDLQRGREA